MSKVRLPTGQFTVYTQLRASADRVVVCGELLTFRVEGELQFVAALHGGGARPHELLMWKEGAIVVLPLAKVLRLNSSAPTNVEVLQVELKKWLAATKAKSFNRRSPTKKKKPT